MIIISVKIIYLIQSLKITGIRGSVSKGQDRMKSMLSDMFPRSLERKTWSYIGIEGKMG